MNLYTFSVYSIKNRHSANTGMDIISQLPISQSRKKAKWLMVSLVLLLVMMQGIAFGQMQNMYWTFNQSNSSCTANALINSPANANITGSYSVTDGCSSVTTGVATSGSPFIAVTTAGNAIRNSLAESQTKYWDFTLTGSDADKLSNIKVYFQIKRSNATYVLSSAQISCSVDGGTYTGAQNISNSTSWSASIYDFSGITGVTNSITFRIACTASSGWGTQSNIVDIDNFQVQGIIPTPGGNWAETFNYTSLTQTFTVPNGVNSITVAAWGGGGAGGGVDGQTKAGGGGEGGSFVRGTIDVVPLNQYDLVVGRGGQGQDAANGTSGTASSFSRLGTTYFNAIGGVFGYVGNSFGNGGSASNTGNITNGTSTSNYYGGNGGTGTNTSSATSGGGGGSAGAGGNGGNGGAPTAGTAGAAGSPANPGVAGAVGRGSQDDGDGNVAVEPGGGGSGARNANDNTNYIGGNGGNGRIIVSYTLPNNPTITLSSTSTAVCYYTSAQNALLAFTGTSGSPDKYSIDFASGINDVIDATLPATPITIAIPAGLAAGNYTGTLTVKNSFWGFVSSGYNITVTVNAFPTCTAPATSPVSYCQNATATALSVTGAAGSGTISSYKWYSSPNSNGSGASLLVTHTSSSTTDTYVPVTTATGNLYYYVLVTNSNNCMVPSGVSDAVTVVALPTFSYTPTDISCNGSNDGKITITANGGNGNFTFSLLSGDNFPYNGSSPKIIENLAPNTYTIRVKDSNNCIQTICQ